MLDKQNRNVHQIDKVTTSPPVIMVNSRPSRTVLPTAYVSCSANVENMHDSPSELLRFPLGCCEEINLVLEVE